MKEMRWTERSNPSVVGESGWRGREAGGRDWRRDDDCGEWQQWDKVWWINAGRSDLNSRQRRQVSMGLKRLVEREQNEVICLLRELRSAIKKGTELAETSDTTNRPGSSSGGETEKTGGGDDDDDDVVQERKKWEELKGDCGQY